MPKRKAQINEDNDETARGALTGYLVGAFRRNPKDVVAGAVAFIAIGAIVGNAIFMQAGRHPSPMFGPPPAFSNAAAPAIPNPLPRPRTLENVSVNERNLDSRLFDNKPQETRAQVKAEPKAESKAEPRADAAAAEPKAERSDPMANLIRHAATPRPQSQRPPQAQAMPPQPRPLVHTVPQQPIQITSNSNVPRPPAAVPAASRGDPLADLISRR